MHGHDRAAHRGGVPRLGATAGEDVREVRDPDSHALANADHLFNGVILRFDRQRHKQLIERLVHQDGLQLVQGAQSRRQIEAATCPDGVVDKAHDLVVAVAIYGQLAVERLRAASAADDEHASCTAPTLPLHTNPSYHANAQRGGDDTHPELHQAVGAERAAGARQRQRQHQQCPHGAGDDETTDLVAQPSSALGIVEPVQAKNP